MNKPSSFVWEKDQREGAEEQKTLQGNGNLATTPFPHWKGLHSTPRTPARSIPSALHLDLMLITDVSSCSDGFGGMPPPKRWFVLLYASQGPGAQ